MIIEDLRTISLFDGLSDDQLGELIAAGEEVVINSGDDLFVEGTYADHWWVLIDGALDLVRHMGAEDHVVGRMDVPGRWAGGFRAWDEHGVYLATGRGASSGRLLRVPAQALRDMFNAWFPFGVHLVAGLYGTARSIESTARQRDALVTLGTLAAGLAHEINNPAAAATRAVDALEESSKSLLSSLGRLARQDFTAEQFVALDGLRNDLSPEANLDPLALSDQEESVTDWLTGQGIANAWQIGPTLVAGGVDIAWCDRAAEVLSASALGPGMEWVASTVAVSGLLAEVKDSTGRISELVAAVRSYSQMDRGARQSIDVTEGIDSTLVMLGHKVRQGIKVIKNFDHGLPHIDAYPGELNQVWTNVIDNAVDAMPDGGTLTITTHAEADLLVVEIADSGHGMAPEVAARAFDAFYTTKDVGKGTGLGLDIARRIVVERHGGMIDIDSERGRTVFSIRLPMRGASA